MARRSTSNMRKARSIKLPVLEALIAGGLVWIENHSYVGKATDGTIVAVGSTFQPEQTEKYLTAHPTPDTW